MGFRINTNIDAMSAHRNMLGTSGTLSKSLERLSSGLRINRAADDASGMTIADSLRAQASGLGQAMKNAGDAISLVQVADGALEESINIVNTIRTKAIQAASDGQNTVSRAAIQADVAKLLEEMNIIADTTAYNGQVLLKGGFVNKSFQVGAYANQTVSVSIDNADASHVGRLATVASTTTQTSLIKLAPADVTAQSADNYAQLGAATSATTGFKVNGVDMAGFLSAQEGDQLSAKGIAAAINETTTNTNVSATAETNYTGTGTTGVVAAAVVAGAILINGVDIAPTGLTVVDKDANGALVAAINDKYLDTGVTASTDASGVLTLTAVDGRNIALSGTSLTALGAGFANGATAIDIDAGGTTAESATSNFYLDGTLIQWDATSTTAGVDGAAMLAALNAAKTAGTISSNYSFSAVVGDTVTITRADGQDVNIAVGTGGGSALGAGQTIDGVAGNINFNTVQNDAYHGEVSLTSSALINVTGDGSTLQSLGFNTDGTTTSVQGVLSGGIADADVTTASAAQVTIQRADSALEALDRVRSGLGSAQNQVEATLRNISVTRVNIQSAESAIRDVDFADESSTFAKMNILVQAGSYALSQANAVQQNIMTLLR